MGQGEQADEAARSENDDVATPAAPAPDPNSPVMTEQPNGNGRGELVTIDFGSLGPQRPDAA